MPCSDSSKSTRLRLRRIKAFGGRCGLCHEEKDSEDLKLVQACHGSLLEQTAKKYHLVKRTFQRDSPENAFVLCSSCHDLLSYRGPNLLPKVLFVPCREICAYLLDVLKDNKTTTVDTIITELLLIADPTPEERKAQEFAGLFELTISATTKQDTARSNNPISQVCILLQPGGGHGL
ncbi:hypothetical protein BT96DRAFT_281788 [Gymnopus androsaceus JB14]|uniref:Uncharacterized protein n=1 Tax=Gymnopus androsaceus JB14 TaxID=1447944 RepID=A0A6A4IBE4_9AGAR|nr:hypothetical protein BT96DRAFT_281788 [Gymnopus androsaceus JB14]